MDVTMDPFLLPMVHGFVLRIMIANPPIRFPFICDDPPCFGVGKCFDEPMQSGLCRIRNDAHADIAATFDNPADHCFASRSASTANSSLLASAKGLIN